MTSPIPPNASVLPPELEPVRPGDPARIGPYRVVGRLGQGGMGTVFGALDGRDACVAVKVVHARFAADAEFRARFAAEIDLMRLVGGLCTAEVHAADADAARPWVATDFVPGRTLRAHVRENGPLEGDMLVAFAAGVAESLAAIHAAGVVHCDLKPGNVILAPEGPKVLDFGIARHAAGGERSGGAVFGSPGWMSPERYDGTAPTPAADVFAWGAMVAFAATGRNPFGRADTAELARRARQEPADTEGVPEELLPLVERSLAKDPAGRPTADAVFGEVMALMDGVEEAEGIRLEGLPARTERLRVRLGERWRGIDAGWHRPALWVAAATATGMAATASTATGAGVAGAGAAAATGAGTGGAGAGAGAAAAVGAGAGTGKVVAVVAAAVIGTAAVGTGGYFAADALTGPQEAASSPTPAPSPSTPQEFVAMAADLAAGADSFVVAYDQRITEEEARRQPDSFTGSEEERIEYLIAVSGQTGEYRYTSEPDPVLEETRANEGGGRTYLDTGGDLYLYSVVDDSWRRNPPDVDRDRHTVDALLQPLRSIAESDDLVGNGSDTVDGVAATHYSGTFEAVEYRNADGGATTSEALFDLWIGADGYPVRLDYTTESLERELVFESFGEPVSIDGPDQEKLIAGVCGPLSTADGGTVVEVSSGAYGVTCEEAMGIVGGYFDGRGEVAPGGGGSGGFATVDGWTCGWTTAGAIELALPGDSIGGCTELESDEPVPPRIDFLKTG
ncbi:serine/threonine protein kinase [Actinorugispora endophytica]|uniref:Serine/threonine protein kinase n=1 Tax=Actinorugispora endophytica TaxID=1605990 RepID=A0A4R6UYN9_9ACTN|nr:serine/threonine protein kinase [Actinorugispora endophytica]